jgi:pyruvate dehydrogenase E2 component (dihydrolipoamide acetyltransferase)
MVDYSSFCVGIVSPADCAVNDQPSGMESRSPTVVPLSHVQRLIAQRMLASKRSKACFYLETRADVTDLMGMRHSLSKALGVKITSNAFLIHALALAAKEYPLTVGRLVGPTDAPPATEPCATDAGIQIAGSVNVGFAVNGSQGLVVPVVKEAHNKTLAEIACEEKLLTSKARSNKLTLEDMEGETIALSNLGAFDIDSFLGIVPPPVSTILTAGKVTITAVPRDGRPEPRKLMSLSLAVDHRVIQPDYAARFLQSISRRLEEPEKLI